MEHGTIPLEDLSGGLDLQSTLESGQSYLWTRTDHDSYGQTGAYGGNAWYETVADGEVVRARQRDGVLEWQATTDATDLLTHRLRLTDDLQEITRALPQDPLLDQALTAYQGMRVTRDPFFPCLISFICSPQMRVPRIYQMQHALRQTYGEPITVDDRTYYAYPTPARLADTTEADLRALGLGYRAPYVQRTAELIASGELPSTDIPDEYEPARSHLTQYVGVGMKVADCVCLFALDHLEAVPLDTWVQTAIATHYPGCDHGAYPDTSRAIRDRLGPYAGYAQTYLFHYLRHRF